jgi:hypothetical protein
VPNQSYSTRRKPGRNITDKLLAMSGIKEAIKMVRQYAFKGAREEAWVRQFLRGLSKYNDDIFVFDDSDIDYEFYDELLEYLAQEAGPKIAELWDLSEGAGDIIAGIIYLGENAVQTTNLLQQNAYLLPFVLVANMKDLKISQSLYYGGAIVTSRKDMLPNHIYLDVTFLNYDAFHLVYKDIASFRQLLGLQKKDMREGAPETFDTAKAIKCAEMADADISSKEIARELKFPIYTEDNPGGTYSLFRKYLKKGREIREKLNTLESFLDNEMSFLLGDL